MAEAAASREVSKQLYKDRPEWSDIKPIYHAPHEEAVIRIAMTEECKQVCLPYLTRWQIKRDLGKKHLFSY